MPRRRCLAGLIVLGLGAAGCLRAPTAKPASSAGAARGGVTVSPFGTLGAHGTAELLRSIGASGASVSTAESDGYWAADAIWVSGDAYRYLAVGLPPGGFLQPWNLPLRTGNANLPALVASEVADAFMIAGQTFGVPLLQRPVAVVTNLDFALQLGLPAPPASWTWSAFLLYCTQAEAVISAGPPGRSVISFGDTLPWMPLLLATLLQAAGYPLPVKPPLDFAAAAPSSALSAFATWIGEHAGAGSFGSGTALMALSAGAPPAQTASAVAGSYFPRLPVPYAPVQTFGLGARRAIGSVSDLAARLLAVPAQEALATSLGAGPAASAAAGFSAWLPASTVATVKPVAPLLGLQAGTAGVDSAGVLADPAFTVSLAVIANRFQPGHGRALRPVGAAAVRGALSEAAAGINACTSCWGKQGAVSLGA